MKHGYAPSTVDGTLVETKSGEFTSLRERRGPKGPPLNETINPLRRP